MGRVNTPVLTDEQREELKNGVKQGDRHCFRTRCHVVLLKSEGRKSDDVGSITDMCAISVNSWVNRYKKSGISGLRTRPGRGRRPLIDPEGDREGVLSAIKANRQRMRTAKAQWEAASGKKVCDGTFRAFLKTLVDGTSA